MNQIEMEKIADVFDRNREGIIDHNEVMSVLRGTKQRRPMMTTRAELTDAEKIEHEVCVVGICSLIVPPPVNVIYLLFAQFSYPLKHK